MKVEKTRAELIREARNKYQREYFKREENKGKRKQYNDRYWEKKAKALQEENGINEL